MTQYLLALHKADNEHSSPEQTRQVWAGVNALGDRVKDAGAFVFKGGLQSRRGRRPWYASPAATS